MSKFLRIVEIIIALPKIVLMKLADYCPFGKIGLAFISFGVFNLVFTFWVAVILFNSLFIHEIGHAWVSHSKRMGLKGIYLFPWFSGCCVYRYSPISEKTKILFSLMGPAFSIAFASIMGIAFLLSKEIIFAFCSFTIASMSLCDLTPIKPHRSQHSLRDGTKIVRIILSGKIRGSNLMLFGVSYITLMVIGLGIVFFTFSIDFLKRIECFYQPFICNGISFLISFFNEHI